MKDLVERLREIGAHYSACDRQQTIYEAADALEAAQDRIEAVRRETPTQHVLNARVAEHRKAVEWLHSRANAMNDPHAKQILNSAALAYGVSRALTEAKEDRT